MRMSVFCCVEYDLSYRLYFTVVDLLLFWDIVNKSPGEESRREQFLFIDEIEHEILGDMRYNETT